MNKKFIIVGLAFLALAFAMSGAEVYLSDLYFQMSGANITNVTYLYSQDIFSLVYGVNVSTLNASYYSLSATQSADNFTQANQITNLNSSLVTLIGNISSYTVASALTWDALDYPNSTQFLTTGNLLNIDESYLDSLFATTYYNYNTIAVIAGTNTTSPSNMTSYDNIAYNISESGGSPGLDVRVNFTGVQGATGMIFRIKTIGNTQPVNIHLWDYDDSEWESYRMYETYGDYNIFEIGIYDEDEHMSGGIVQVRIYHADAGNTNHVHSIDWISVVDGPATFSTQEGDPLSVHIDAIGNEFFYNETLELNYTYVKPLIDTDTYQYLDQNVNSTGTPKWVTVNATQSAYHNVTRYGTGCVYQNLTGSMIIESICTV